MHRRTSVCKSGAVETIFFFCLFVLFRWRVKLQSANVRNDSKWSKLVPTSTGWALCLLLLSLFIGKDKTKLWFPVRNRVEVSFIIVAAGWNTSTLTLCAFIVLYITSSTLETRYIWKFYSVYNLFLFCGIQKLWSFYCVGCPLNTLCPDFWLMKLRSRNDQMWGIWGKTINCIDYF